MFTFTSPNYDPFVWPFAIGMILLCLILIVKYVKWIASFSLKNRIQILKGIFTLRTLRAVKEVILESLVHRKIYKVNPLLGYMHMCFGLGWFLLIVVGHAESAAYKASWANTPYYSIFFQYFLPAGEHFKGDTVYAFFMDLFLTFILSGLLLAVIKRFYSRAMGMKRTTKQRPYDMVVLTSLWLIFPFRFLAESFNAGITGHGSFLTHSAGVWFASFLPIEQLNYPMWWCYSLALGIFFLMLPGARYMHIPTEVVYIFLKNWGVKIEENSGEDTKLKGLLQFELYSCSRCGICLNTCQLATSLNNKTTQPVYFLRSIRDGVSCTEQANNCLMCGRCEENCPVGIDLNAIRMSQRADHSKVTEQSYNYITSPQTTETQLGKVAYFAGCMGHLTPNVIKSMCSIFEKAQVDYTFIDEDGGVCCGRPMKLSGNVAISEVLMKKNRDRILASGAEILVTTCPICYKTFKEDYNLPITVMHHTEYIALLMHCGVLNVRKSALSVAFHNPCELGRGCGVTEAPDNILNSVATLLHNEYDGKKSLCCGGSLANNAINQTQRTEITKQALSCYTALKPDVVVTACPMCKKTFVKIQQPVPIVDIAELVADNI